MAKKNKKTVKSVKEEIKEVVKEKDDHCYTCAGKGLEEGCGECGKKK